MVYWYPYRIQFYETDAMGVLHHSNTVRLLERARVAWMNDQGWMKHHLPEGSLCFAVTGIEIKYFAAAAFNQELKVGLVAQARGPRLKLSHGVYASLSGKLLSQAQVELAAVNGDLRPCRLPHEIIHGIEQSDLGLVEEPFGLTKEVLLDYRNWPKYWPTGEAHGS